MRVALILAPTLQGAPMPPPFAHVMMQERPLVGEGVIYDGAGYAVIGRAIDIDKAGAAVYYLMLQRIGGVAKSPLKE